MKSSLLIPLLLLILGTSCEKTQFDDPTTFTEEEAKAITPDYYFLQAASSFSSALFWANDGYYYGFGISALSDQTTVTNRVQEWWDFAKEPRIRLNNSQSYGGVYHFSYPYARFYQANLDATKVLAALDAGTPAIDEDSVDRTAEVYAVAYLVKGIAQGYLGAIYDRGIIVDQDLGTTGTQAFPNSYKELIENAMTYFDKAIAAANAAPSITTADFYVNIIMDKTVFIKYANSMAARLLASIPRDKAEATALGSTFWNRVLTYAQNGLTTDLTAAYISGGFYNYSVYYGGVNASGAAYLPADIKIPYLADNTGTYPNSYPTDASVILGPVSTSDARFTSYFQYYSAFGYLREDRGRNLFSNYKHYRWINKTTGGNVTTTGNINPVFLANEVVLLRAEAKYWLGDYAGAAAELNAATAERKSLGGLSDIAATQAAVLKALHYEYSISIDLAGGCTNPWAFMRRNNLLQKGTPTEFPVPEQQILLTSESVYTFGGADYAGEKGKWGETATASGDGAWK